MDIDSHLVLSVCFDGFAYSLASWIVCLWRSGNGWCRIYLDIPLMNNFDKPFLRTAFSESDGSGSFGRLTSALLILCVIVWDSIGMLYGGSIISGAEFTLQITGALLPY